MTVRIKRDKRLGAGVGVWNKICMFFPVLAAFPLQHLLHCFFFLQSSKLAWTHQMGKWVAMGK